MSGYVELAVLLLLSQTPLQSECMVYHAAFLGRDPTYSAEFSTFGQLHYQKEATVINAMNCSWHDDDNSGQIKTKNATSNCEKLIPNGFQLSSTGFKVESSSSFTLHVYQTDSTGELGDGYLAIPDEHLGKEYYVPTYCSIGGYCQIAVAATTDETSLNIVFPNHIALDDVECNGKSITPGEPLPFKLNENDVLHIESTKERIDLSGTYLTSDETVSVFTGARDVLNTSSMIEQIPPTTKWGTEFVVAPNHLNEAGDVIKIITKSDDTTIHILGYSLFTISKAGEWKELRLDWGMHSTIRATQPILVLQVMSLNLYNDTSMVPGNPAMVIVPHIEQWTDTTTMTDCLPDTNNKSIVTSVSTSYMTSLADSTTTHTIRTEVNTSNKYYVTQNIIVSSTSSENEIELSSSGDKRSIYGYCSGTSAVLLVADWTWENKECVRTRPVPGDGLDNDCDGKVDEDNCTKNDLSVNFTSTPTRPSGEIHHKKLNVRGASPIHVQVNNCGMAVVALRVSNDPSTSFLVHIGSSSVYLLLTCPNNCTHDNAYHQFTNFECENRKDVTVGWNYGGDGTTTIDFTAVDMKKTYTVTNRIDFDEMYIASYSGTADFVVEMPEKDCGKIKSGESADNYGTEFIVPERAWKIYLTNVGMTSVTATLYHYNGTKINQNDISMTSTVDIDSSSYGGVFIRANDELSVYAINEDTSSLKYGYSILPVDVFGPYYHVYNESAATDCEYYTFKDYFESNVVIEKTAYHYQGSQEIFERHRPGALFCGSGNDLVQIPPHDSLGTQYYIPSLELDGVAKAELRIVSTEDSTVVIIRGNYDNLDTIELTGNNHIRVVEPNMLYNISSTKPIQVLLQLGWGVAGSTMTSVVAVPPVDQYKSLHYLPGKLNTIINTSGSHKRYIVYENGTEDMQTVDPDQQAIKTDFINKSFVLNILSLTSGQLVVPGDVMYNNINKVCRITKGTPGDGVDNDCDGLTDEEQCLAAILLGEIDTDIDGCPNEDCAAGTEISPLPLSLVVPKENIDCSTNSGNQNPNNEQNDNGNDDNSDTTVTIDNGNIPNPQKPSSFPRAKLKYGTGPSYEPVASSGANIIIPNSDDEETTSNSTEDETACDCACPCGWVDKPKNYSVEELKAVVEEIQEKLKVTKASLSSTVRSKSSAKDDRTEAAAVGIVGVVFLVSLIGAIFLLDLATIARDVRMLMANIRQVFQP